MRIAMISDVHGNVHAFDAVLDDLDQSGPYDEIVYGGDLIFNGAFPSECVDRLRERGYRAVRGNTDEFLVEMARDGNYELSITSDDQRHTPPLQTLDRWALDRLSSDQIDYLAEFPVKIDIEGPDGEKLTICHAAPWSAHVTVFPDASEDVAREMLDKAGTQAVAYGHIHVQYQRQIDGRLLCSVGSVGAPFDGDPRAAFAVLTNNGNGWDVEFRRVAYDNEAAAASLTASTLPNKEQTAAGIRTGRRNI
jgi:predicted phosphodiesterase